MLAVERPRAREGVSLRVCFGANLLYWGPTADSPLSELSLNNRRQRLERRCPEQIVAGAIEGCCVDCRFGLNEKLREGEERG